MGQWFLNLLSKLAALLGLTEDLRTTDLTRVGGTHFHGSDMGSRSGDSHNIDHSQPASQSSLTVGYSPGGQFKVSWHLPLSAHLKTWT